MKKHLLILLSAGLFAKNLSAQSMTGTIVSQPCNNNGQIAVTVSGLTPPISYTYTSGWGFFSVTHLAVNSVIDNLTGISGYIGSGSIPFNNPNIWQIDASDGTNTASTSLTLTPAFQMSLAAAPAICPSTTGTVTASNFIGGTSPFSAVWTNVSSTNNYPGNPASVPLGTYTVSVTDGAGCIVLAAPNTSFANLYVSAVSNISFTVSSTTANCTNGTAFTGPISGGTAPYSYLWSNSATTSSISGLMMGLYSCTVTDVFGCEDYDTTYVSQAISINYTSTVTDATCLQNNGSIISFVSGGTLPYTFLWSNSANTQNINGLAGNQSYNVLITDANGCIGNGNSYVNVTTPINVTYTSTPSSCTSPTGSSTLTPTGGLAPYSIVWNTFPSTIGISISNKPSGNYGFMVTDANGCIRTGNAYIQPTSTIWAYISNGVAICPATSASMNISASGTNPPLTYLWSNSSTNTVITAGVGNYNCTVTDAAGCSVTKSGSIIQTSPITVGFNTTPASCVYANDGSIAANALGGTAPYTYNWSNSQTGPNATSLSNGHYYLNVTDANGCQNTTNFNVNGHVFVGYTATNTSCYCTITGTVYADANNNCIRNTGENGIATIQIHCSGFGYTYTDANGVYSFLVPTGTYTVSETLQAFYPLSGCQTNNQVVSVVAASNCSTTVNFANGVIPIHDLHIITSNINQPVPGNSYSQKVIVQNEGTLLENTAQLGYVHDGQLSYSNCTPWTLTQLNSLNYPSWYSITSGFPSLNVGATSTSFFTYNVPTNIPISTNVNFKDTITSAAPIATNWLTDYTPWNNISSNQAVVVASYDPNFKEVSPQGVGPNGDISTNDTLLTYIVHFQNTGSYYAQNIVVTDTLDANLKITSLRPGYSDHSYTASVSENGVATFTFKNINLPWQSAFGDALSSGMFVYTIKMKNNLPLGTQLKNKAAIFFDYNAPIITNTTLNTLVAAVPQDFTGLQNIDLKGNSNLMMYPNPAKDAVTIYYESKESSVGILRLTDISGRLVFEKTIELSSGTNRLTENTSQLQNGIYLVQIKTSTESITKKLILAK